MFDYCQFSSATIPLSPSKAIKKAHFLFSLVSMGRSNLINCKLISFSCSVKSFWVSWGAHPCSPRKPQYESNKPFITSSCMYDIIRIDIWTKFWVRVFLCLYKNQKILSFFFWHFSFFHFSIFLQPSLISDSFQLFLLEKESTSTYFLTPFMVFFLHHLECS